MKLQNPRNYKTQRGLLNALTKASEQSMTVALAQWFHDVQETLIEVWDWEEKQAAHYVAGYTPNQSVYRPNN